jgi:hypothetical protein
MLMYMCPSQVEILALKPRCFGKLRTISFFLRLASHFSLRNRAWPLCLRDLACSHHRQGTYSLSRLLHEGGVLH